jgi:hypothetical protein
LFVSPLPVLATLLTTSHKTRERVLYSRQASAFANLLHKDRRHSSDENGCGNSLCAVPSDVSRNFASASGVTHQSDILEIERLDDSCQIIGVPIHVVPRPGLTRAAMATAVMCSSRRPKHAAAMNRL